MIRLLRRFLDALEDLIVWLVLGIIGFVYRMLRRIVLVIVLASYVLALATVLARGQRQPEKHILVEAMSSVVAFVKPRSQQPKPNLLSACDPQVRLAAIEAAAQRWGQGGRKSP